MADATWELDFDERFDAPQLDPSRWLPYYLPQWSSRAQAAARYDLTPAGLELRIDADQPPWCPELDGETVVSSLQTGVFAGPVGCRIGQHRFAEEAVVREAQPEQQLYLPQRGRVAIRCRASADPRTMVALWMIGFEDEPQRSAEICVCEIFGRDVQPRSARVGMGVHPFGDPRLVDDFDAVQLDDFDATELHEYAVEWGDPGCVFSVDGHEVRRTAQAPDYPMQLMLGIYERADWAHEADDATAAAQAPHPKRFAVESVRGWRRAH